jgi:hypothetical protein
LSREISEKFSIFYFYLSFQIVILQKIMTNRIEKITVLTIGGDFSRGDWSGDTLDRDLMDGLPAEVWAPFPATGQGVLQNTVLLLIKYIIHPSYYSLRKRYC